MKKILLVGLGDLGARVLESLARTPTITNIICADKDQDEGTRKTNCAVAAAAQLGFYPEVQFIGMDLSDVSRTAEMLGDIGPDLVYNSATFQIGPKYWAVRDFSQTTPGLRKLLTAGHGPWLPMQLSLTYKLMLAVRKSGIKTHVVNASLPDAVNPILGKVGLAPTVGVGNLDNTIPVIKKIVSEKLGTPMRSIKVCMVAHHFLASAIAETGDRQGAPYFLQVFVGEENVTTRLNLDRILFSGRPAVLMPGGRNGYPLVTASSVKNMLGILNDTRELTHAPGPLGLPGGYPVELSSNGVQVVLPQELSLQDAIKINEDAQRYDGIERIQDDGTTVFTEKSVGIMKDVLGYDYDSLRISESEERAEELKLLWQAFVNKHNLMP